MNAIVRADEINLDELQRTAKMLAASGYFDTTKGDMTIAIAQLATKILAGRELGYGPFASVQGIHVIQGKPTISANLMAAAVKNHPRYDYRVKVMTDKEVTVEFFEDKQSLGMSTFTAQDATNAGLTGKQIWKNFPRNMLFARAMSNGVRFYCPDVFSGSAVYVPEELGGETDSNGIVVVDSSTGEIVEQAPAAQTNGDGNHAATVEAEPNFYQPANETVTEPATTNGDLRKRFHAEGTQTFSPQKWDEVRDAICVHFAVESSNDLPEPTVLALAESFRAQRREWQKWQRGQGEMPVGELVPA